jgi:hypothetical protein
VEVGLCRILLLKLQSTDTNGKKFGRPRIQKPKDFKKIVDLWRNDKITAVEAMKRLNLNRGTFYRMVKQKESNK